MRRRRWGSTILGAAMLIASSCASSSVAPPPSATGATAGNGTSSLSTAVPTLAWVAGQAEKANGEPPPYTAESTCGSSTATFLAELADVSPDKATVMKEWADVVPGGKQMMVSGTIASTHLGPQDLPLSHTFGDDLSMNVKLDPQFTKFSRQLGKPVSDEPAGTAPKVPATPKVPAASTAAPAITASTPPTAPKVDEHENGNVGEDEPGFMHVEISAGLIPHTPRFENPNGQTWRDLSDFNLTKFQPGLKKPAVGDPVVIMGRWIIDCGHNNYGTELHAITFLAWTHQENNRTTIHFYQNPFRDSEVYSPDAAQLGRTRDPARFADPANKAFPPYFVDEVVRLLQNKTDRLRSQQLIDTTIASAADWKACGTGPKVRVDYDVVSRPGTELSVSSPDAQGCVSVHSALGSSYIPPIAKLHTCVLPWAFLDDIIGGAVPGGAVNVRKIIKDRVPEQSWPLVDRDPEVSCGDALAGPDITITPAGQNNRTIAEQPFPFYGTITLTPES